MSAAAGRLAGRLAGPLLALALALLFALSPLALDRLGLRYDAPGGPLPEKVHPGTWVALLALLARLAAEGAALPDALLRRHPGAPLLALALLGLFLHAALVQGVPFTPLIDTFALPLALFALLFDARGPRARALALGLHAALALNAALALGEVATGLRLTPIVAGGLVIEDDWRASALFGHPLANALLGATALVALASGGARDLPPAWRAPALGLQGLGLLAFGGRAALVGALALLTGLGLLALARLARGGRADPRALGRAALLAPLLALGLAAALAAGALDQLLERFQDDRGSASTRLAMFALFDGLPTPDLLFGPDPARIASAQGIEGLEFGIESFPVAMALTYGLVPAGLFLLALLAFAREVSRATLGRAALPLALFLAVAATSVSLSAKSPVLGLAAALLLLTGRADAGARAGRGEGAWTRGDPSRHARAPAPV